MTLASKPQTYSDFAGELLEKIKEVREVKEKEGGSLSGKRKSHDVEHLNIYNEGRMFQIGLNAELNVFQPNLTDIDRRIKNKIDELYDLEVIYSDELGEGKLVATYETDSIETALSVIESAFKLSGVKREKVRVEFHLAGRTNPEFEFGSGQLEDPKYLAEKFVKKFGRGNPDSREKLSKTMDEELEGDYSEDEVTEMVDSFQTEREKENLETILKSKNLSSQEERASFFVDLFGKGNEKLKDYASEIFGIERERFNKLVKVEFEEKKEAKELDNFKQELGLKASSRQSSRIEEVVEDTDADLDVIESLNSVDLSWSDIKGMSGFEFEEFIEELFEAKGFDAEQTQEVGDQGADVIAEKPYEKIAIQVKNHKDKISNSAIQEVRGAIDHYGCDKGMVISASRFTSSARELADSNNIELWSKGKIMDEKEKYLEDSL